jgi:metal-sulfur cluster biosynthetic enzyme
MIDIIKIDLEIAMCYDSRYLNGLFWDKAIMSQQTQAITEEGLREALRVVVDPEIGMNVIELGLIRGVEITDERAHLNVIMTTPFCPYAPQLLEQIRRTAQEYTGVPTTIEMGMEMWDPTMMEEGAADDWGLF